MEKQCFIYTTKRVRRDDVTMTKMTSARAAKELRSLNDQRDALFNREKKTSAFTAALQEDIESVRPNYNFEETQNQLQQIEDRVRRLKHSVNHFNLTTIVPGFEMTVDQMLVYIPQLTERSKRLDKMRRRLPKERAENGFNRTQIIEYIYANYDVKAAEEAYRVTMEELACAQNALDMVNATIEFDVDFEPMQ